MVVCWNDCNLELDYTGTPKNMLKLIALSAINLHFHIQMYLFSFQNCYFLSLYTSPRYIGNKHNIFWRKLEFIIMKMSFLSQKILSKNVMKTYDPI